ncbi:hypothetical protein [Bradyrhizobium glycinis]|uniref:hypothetical protein n=1 Tax=Bradyrhizobium glycinis TaxID=2751812 RepID=UPI0018D6E406|nr:hypothetical protein [Bradyrhizobium glycinis]MBH5372949.1 hypothetical protein [Bradyrhizobium glycinis]
MVLTEDDLRGRNCAVQALAILCRMTPDEVSAKLDAHAILLGEPSAFVENGLCLTQVVDGYLKSAGWARWKRQAADYGMIPLPPTCLVQMPGHVFAMINGFVWNAWCSPPPGVRTEVLGFWSPPGADCEMAVADFMVSEGW